LVAGALEAQQTESAVRTATTQSLALLLRPLAVEVLDSITQPQAMEALVEAAVVVYQEPLYLGLGQPMKVTMVELEAPPQSEQALIYSAVAVVEPGQMVAMPQHQFAVAQVLALPRLLQGQASPEQSAGKVAVDLVVTILAWALTLLLILALAVAVVVVAYLVATVALVW
jgi:hypothetical protein